MKRVLLTVTAAFILFGCAPAIDRNLLKEGSRDVSFDALRRDPGRFEGKLFVLGGVIVKTRLTQTGSEIEGLAVPVDRYGYFKDSGRSEGRFIAVLPMEERLLDPEVFSSGRRVTFAGEFTGLRKAKIDEMEYVYPVFRIRDIHLWQRERVYYPYYYDPWFSPYPYYFRDPWWSYPSFYYYDRDHRDGSINRRAPPNQTPPRDTSAPLPSPERHERMPEKERPSR